MGVTVRRFDENPLLSPAQVRPSRPDFEVVGTFNAAAFEFDGAFRLLVRVCEAPVQDDLAVRRIPELDVSGPEPVMGFRHFRRDDPHVDFSDPRLIGGPDGRNYLTAISHLRLARSTDGRRWTIDDEVLIGPTDAWEQFGIEDPRVTCLDGEYLITYVAVSRRGINTCLLTTRDWQHFERRGVIFVADNKDACIFPATFGGRYAALHRPTESMFAPRCIWLAFSDDLVYWGDHAVLIEPRPGRWDSERIGPGPPPIRTERGWLDLYHASDGSNYCLGAVLLDLHDPTQVIGRSDEPLMCPQADYEQKGFYGNVVFANGQIERPDGTLWVYYGAADSVTAGAQLSISDILASIR